MVKEVLEVLARRGTPPGQGGFEILGRDDGGCPFDHAARVPAVQVGAVLEQGCSRWCVRQLPTVQTVLSSCVHQVVDIPVLAFRTVEVPQIRSSTELNDNFEAKCVLFRCILRIFSDSPERS